MTEATAKLRYHHGNLRAALLDAGLELARAGGPDAVVVRAASRRVGVSHNAAYRHFPDRDALLKAVSERCMSELARLIERLTAEAGAGDPGPAAARRRLTATGAAYVTFALDEPGLFRTAFAVPKGLPHFHAGEGVGDSGLNPFELLTAQLDGLVAAGALPPERRPYAELAAWSAVHGFAMLVLDGPLRELPPEDREAALQRLLETVDAGLLAPAPDPP